jgi:hypothetical protein
MATGRHGFLRVTSDCTEALKPTIWAIPDLEPGVDNGREFIKRAEEAARVLPNPLGRD